MLPDDNTLTETGLDGAAATKPGRILLIACGALAREILALKDINGWDHMDLTCLPAKYHLFPDKIVPEIEASVAKHRSTYDEIFVVYADCGTGGMLQTKCEDLGIKMLQGPHCYSFYEGNDTFANLAEDEITAFYLTDFLVRQFDAFIMKPMGLDKHPQLREMYFGNYEKLVYQAQVNDPDLDKKAQAAAETLGLRYERRFTGYGDLHNELAALNK
ncbi:DUF1638 domain-containing protein [Halocynthiibacter namhaensis]|uniref:DUF1638 domain-containing protein n=1 Tax=Halocynthiibacter namhaensis TaxID=1290553 RepID=UPI0005798620|nr:DUF1638 domain-containing protein [Halocynthiibacter namhaensis]